MSDKPTEYFVPILPQDLHEATEESLGRGPLVCETHLKGATKANAHQAANRLEKTFGKCLIGRVTIEAIDQVNPPQVVADLLREKDDRLDQVCETLWNCNDKKLMKLTILEWLRNL